MLRENGTTRLNVVSRSSGPSDPFLQAVQEAAAGDFTVLGEIGRGADGVIIYLARETSSRRLVALRLQREGQMADEYGLELVRHLDNSMPAPDSKCVKCGETVTGWARFCGHCGADLSGAAPAGDDAVDRALMLEAVKEAVAGQYDVLGEMSRNEGGGAVYFAKDISSGKIVALRLQREGLGEEFSLGLTTALKPIARSLGVRSPATQAMAPVRKNLPQAETSVASGKVPEAAPPRRTTPPPPPKPRGNRNPGAKFMIGGGLAAILLAAIVVFTLPRSDGRLEAPPADTAPTPVAVAEPQVSDTTQPAAAESPPPADPSPVRAAPASAAPKNATVRLSGLPAGAVVQVDGTQRSGRSLSLAAGSHQMSISAPGYESRTETLRVRAGEAVAWSPTLTRTSPPVAAAPKPAPTPPPASGCSADVKSEDWTAAFKSCMSEAMDDKTAAKRNLGMLYERGHGVSKSEKSAASWYEAAADDGDRAGMLHTAEAYEHGDGVKKNEATALSWYTKAANAGVMDAQSKLGEAYEKGRLGVKEDKAAALSWYKKAAAQGDKDAADKAEDLAKDLAK